jgi:hypothetical protein
MGALSAIVLAITHFQFTVIEEGALRGSHATNQYRLPLSRVRHIPDPPINAQTNAQRSRSYM